MSRSHPSTNPPLDPNDPFVRLLGADERRVARPEFRASLRDRLLTLAPAPGVPIDAPLIGRIVVRPVPVLVAAVLATALIAAVLVLRPAHRDIVVPPPSVEQLEPAARLPVAAAPAAAPVRLHAPSSAAERRAVIADRSAVDRPGKRPVTSASAVEPDDVVPAAPAALRPAPLRPLAATGSGAGVADLAPPVPPAPADAASVAPPRNASSDGGRDRGRPAAAPSATATTNAADASGVAAATAPALLPPEPAEPTPAPVVAMPTVPVVPTPTPGP